MLKAGGYFNTEHRGEDAAGFSFNDILGRISYAKKVFSRADCEDDRQRFYWDKIELPYLYIRAELFDEDGDHVGAKAAAAMIRNYRRNGLPILIRFSIEGATLEMKDKVIKRAIARKVAATIKPANKSCDSGVVEDGRKPKKKDGTFEGSIGAPIEEGVTKFERPDSIRLGCSTEVECDPEVAYEAIDFAVAAQEFVDLAKALTAGSYNAAPGSLTGGSALQREDLGDHKKRIYVTTFKAALRDYDPVTHGGFREYLKSMLPEVSDEFLDRFTELAEEMDVKAKGKFLQKKDPTAKKRWRASPIEGEGYDPELPEWEQKQPGATVRVKHRAGGATRAVEEAEYETAMAGIREEFPPTRELPPRELEPMSLLQVDPGHRGKGSGYVATDTKTGVSFLATPAMTYYTKAEGKIDVPARVHPLYAPTDEEFHEVLEENPHIQEIHDRAMKNWVLVHRLARAGRLPQEVMAHAALFSALSPSTPVHFQELAYAFAHDLVEHHGFDPTVVGKDDPRWDEWEKEFKDNLRNKSERHGKLQTTQVLPYFMREYFDSEHAGIWRKPTKKELDAGKYEDPEQRVRSYVGLDEGKWKGISAYPDTHHFLWGLVQKYGVDGHLIGTAVNAMKDAYEKWQKRDETAKRAGKERPPYEGEATVERFAPKTVRYLLGMMGIGTGVVPDTHFLRHTFGLYPGHRHELGGDPRVDDVKRVLLEARHEPLLQAIDHWYRLKHPAFRHVRERLKQQYGEDFGDQATFPAFWLHWLTVPAHERMRGWRTTAHNEQADHMVLWNAIHGILDKHHIPRDPNDRSLVLHKGESPGLPTLPQRTASAMKDIEDRFGHGAASMAYYMFMVPALMGASKGPELHKAELVTRLLKGEVREEPKVYQWRGSVVEPGEVEFVAGARAGKKMPLLQMTGKGGKHHVAIDDNGSFVRLKADSLNFRIQRPPKSVRAATAVDSMRHGHPTLNSIDAQHDLIHGIDFSKKIARGTKGMSRYDLNTGWYKNAVGDMAYVKPVSAMDFLVGELTPAKGDKKFGAAHREAAFYRLAEFFGLGEHIPVTSVFVHPVTKELYSAQRQVDRGEHYKREPNQDDALTIMSRTGQLDKLALMDMVLNSGDRHISNYMLTPGRGSMLHLIDNGLTLAPSVLLRNMRKYIPNAPHYWKIGSKLNHGIGWYGEPLHPAARSWVHSLDPDKLAEQMAKIGVPNSYVREAVRRLTALKVRVSKGVVSKGAAYYAPFLLRGASTPRKRSLLRAGFTGESV